MATPTTMRGDYVFVGSVTFSNSLVLPADTIADAQVQAAAGIETSKMKHRWMPVYDQKGGVDVVADAGSNFHMAAAGGEIIDVQARIDVAPAGGDLAIQVDVERAANGSNVWASILSATIDFTSGDTDGLIRTVGLASTAVIINDTFRAVVTVSGSTGAQGQGLTVRLQTSEGAGA